MIGWGHFSKASLPGLLPVLSLLRLPLPFGADHHLQPLVFSPTEGTSWLKVCLLLSPNPKDTQAKSILSTYHHHLLHTDPKGLHPQNQGKLGVSQTSLASG